LLSSAPRRSCPPHSLTPDRDPPHLHSFPTRRSSDLHPESVPLSPPLAASDWSQSRREGRRRSRGPSQRDRRRPSRRDCDQSLARSEEHTSELQSLTNIVCRLLLDKNNKTAD